MRASERSIQMSEQSVHLFCKVRPTRGETLIRARMIWRERHAHPTRSPDLSISHVFSQPEKKLPQSTQKPRLVSHTLAAKSPQGRGGDEAECLLVAVKS